VVALDLLEDLFQKKLSFFSWESLLTGEFADLLILTDGPKSFMDFPVYL